MRFLFQNIALLLFLDVVRDVVVMGVLMSMELGIDNRRCSFGSFAICYFTENG